MAPAAAPDPPLLGLDVVGVAEAEAGVAAEAVLDDRRAGLASASAAAAALKYKGNVMRVKVIRKNKLPENYPIT